MVVEWRRVDHYFSGGDELTLLQVVVLAVAHCQMRGAFLYEGDFLWLGREGRMLHIYKIFVHDNAIVYRVDMLRGGDYLLLLHFDVVGIVLCKGLLNSGGLQVVDTAIGQFIIGCEFIPRHEQQSLFIKGACLLRVDVVLVVVVHTRMLIL